MIRWTAEPAALELLERHGGPFDLAAFRACWIASFTSDIDVSWGGRLKDDTRAAIALMKSGPVVESFPLNYGGIVATRPLWPREAHAFLNAARRSAHSRWIMARSVPLGPPDSVCHFGSPIGGWTSVVRVAKGTDMEGTFAHKARRAIRAAETAGGRSTTTRQPEAFLRLYREESRRHIYRYPEDLILILARHRMAWFHEVELEGSTVASVMALRAPTHWMAWLAAQNDQGRAINANYLALAGLIRAASEDGIPAINLGISTGMPGVARFKRRFGAVAVPVTQDRIGSPLGSALDWRRRRAYDWARARKKLTRLFRRSTSPLRGRRP